MIQDLDTSKQEQAKPSNKRMEFSYYMVLSDRALNYEAIATGFSFLGFFLQISVNFGRSAHTKE